MTNLPGLRVQFHAIIAFHRSLFRDWRAHLEDFLKRVANVSGNLNIQYRLIALRKNVGGVALFSTKGRADGTTFHMDGAIKLG